MKKRYLILAALLAPSPLCAAGQCQATTTVVIDSDARCVEQGGINIGISEEEGGKVACMASKEVQAQCGPDGRLTRLHAYSVWFNKMKQFEDSCAAQGGTFSYQDPNFVEPQDESFCLQAIPEMGSNMFEEPLCNYHSFCPSVTVVCDRSCPEHSVARLY
jgi:hypothetical protein